MRSMQYPMKKKSRSLLLFTLFFCSIFTIVGISAILGAEPPLDMSIRKQIGTSIGNKMEGRFSITASGGDNITSLSLLFNGTQVASSPNNSLSFTFETKDYTAGLMNITLIGEDALGNFSQITEIKDFLSAETGMWITVVILGIVVPIALYRLYQRYRAIKLATSSTEDLKKKIKIVLDKDF